MLGTPSHLLRSAISQPEKILPYMKINGVSLVKLLSDRSFEKIPYLIEHILGLSFYADLKSEHFDGVYGVKRKIKYGNIIVNPKDHGLSRDLLLHGVREEISARTFEEELCALNNIVDEPVILEIGANIGYYALLEAHILTNGRIYAIEPDPTNRAFLECNVKYNDYTEIFEICEGALSNKNGTSKLAISTSSNLHRIVNGKEKTEKSISVPVFRPNDYLRKNSLKPTDVNVIRMDVEGHEFEIFQELDQIIGGDQPLLLFVEVHPDLLETSELASVIEKLERFEFNLVSVTTAHESKRWTGKKKTISTFEEVHSLDTSFGVEIIAKKGLPVDRSPRARRD